MAAMTSFSCAGVGMAAGRAATESNTKISVLIFLLKPAAWIVRNSILLRDHHFPRVLRVIFEEGFLGCDVFRGRLNSSSDISDARHQRVLSRRRSIPGVCKQLPGIL